MPTLTFTEGEDNYTFPSSDVGETYTLYFLGGNDTLRATNPGSASVIAYMGDGGDLAQVQSQNVTVFGEAGNDSFDIYSLATANGGDGDDQFNIFGSGATLAGGLGNDFFSFLDGGSGGDNVTIYGDDGDDQFYYNPLGSIVGTTVNGGPGNDAFYGFRSGVTLAGGAGNDIYRLVVGPRPGFVEMANAGTDTVQASQGMSFTLPDNIENIVVLVYAGPNSATATLTGNALNNIISGSDYNEIIYGLDGNDVLNGGKGSDTLVGGSGSDTFKGSVGNDTLQGDDGSDILNGGTGDDNMLGGAGNDTFYVDSLNDLVTENAAGGSDRVYALVSGYTLADNVEKGFVYGPAGLTLSGNALGNSLTGNSGNDILYGNDGNDTLKGGDGDDQLDGGDGADVLNGMGAGDTLLGDAGNDKLYGGAGTDYLTGGTGNDLFLFDDGDFGGMTSATADEIVDFVSGQDKIDLSAVDANSGLSGDQSFAFIGTAAFSNFAGELRYEQISGATYVSGDTNGDGSADFMIKLDGLHTLSGTDFGL